MQIGNLVWKGVHGILRFGIIVDMKPREDGWTYYLIDWHNDLKYERAKKEGLDCKNLIRESEDDWYRCDSVNSVDMKHLSAVIQLHRDHHLRK